MASRLRAGEGFEAAHRTFSAHEFLLVDATFSPGLRTPVHSHERPYFGLVLRGGYSERYRLRTCQVERARHELETTDKPLSEVALSAGFYDQSHASTTFKRLIGITPGAYRAHYRTVSAAGRKLISS